MIFNTKTVMLPKNQIFFEIVSLPFEMCRGKCILFFERFSEFLNISDSFLNFFYSFAFCFI